MKLRISPFFISISLILLLFLWMVSGFFSSSKNMDHPEFAKEGANDKVYKLIEVLPEMHSRSIKFTAEVKAKYHADLYPEVQGRIISIHKASGDELAKGETILRINPGNAAEALAKAQDGLEAAKLNYESSATLMERGIQSRYAMENAKSRFNEAKMNLVAAQDRLSKYSIGSPGKCKIYNLRLDVGDIVTNSTKIGSCINDDYMTLTFYVSERELRSLKNSVSNFYVVDDIGNKHTASLRVINESSPNKTAKTFAVELEMENLNHSFADGQAAEVILTEKENSVYKIPHSSLSVDNKGRLSIKTLSRPSEEGKSRVETLRVDIIDEDQDWAWVKIQDEKEGRLSLFVSGHKYLLDKAQFDHAKEGV